MGVLRTIFIILLIYYIFKFVMRLLLPVVVQKTVRHMEETIRNQSQQYHQANQPAYEPKQQYPQEKKKVGEYVDFEEIE